MVIKEGPTWDQGVKKTKFPKLSKNLKVDVAIIGGGITGITSAYLLSKAGKKVVLLEKNQLCTGATGVTTAFITQSLDTETTELIRMFGKEKAKLALQSHGDAITIIKKIVKKNKIDCEFQECSNYIYSIDSDEEYLVEEMTALNSLGVRANLTRAGYPCDYPSIEVPNQAKFHPLKYLYALARIAKRQGVQIHEKTEVKNVFGEGPYLITTKTGESIQAKQVIVATYWPLDNKLYFRKGTYNSYIYELQIAKREFEEGTYEDDKNPYYYFRIDSLNKNFDRMILGGADHRADIPLPEKRSFAALERYLKESFPNLKYKIVRKWSGPILEPVDGLASIGPGKDKQGIFYCTGFSGNGMTYGTIAAEMFSDAILGKKNPYAELYRPYRMPSLYQLANKGLDYSQELFNGVIKNLFQGK